MKSASSRREKPLSICSKKKCWREKLHFLKKDKSNCLAASSSLLIIYSICMAIIMIFCFHLIFHRTNIKNTLIQPQKEIETCDLSKGQWIPDTTATLYTNYSCTTIPPAKNCFLNGRIDREFLHWRWKPNQCELPRFSPKTFLSMLRGKKMAFIGDSLARNHMESLLCLLSTVETPNSIEIDAEDRFPTWEFPKHNFTLKAFWSQFLITAVEHVDINGTGTGGVYDLHLDRVETRWSEKLPSIDYAVFSGGNWFRRPNDYLYEGGNLVAVEDGGLAMRKAFRAAFKAVNDCKNCKKIISLLRTYSPGHFENGGWNAGGWCNRTRPIGRDEVEKIGQGWIWGYRKIQEEEVEAAAREGSGNVFEVVDVTDMMSVRADAHPGRYWPRENRIKGNSDCVHWCMPGPVDTWNDLLLETIKRSSFNTN